MNSLIRSARVDTAPCVLDRAQPVPAISKRTDEADGNPLANMAVESGLIKTSSEPVTAVMNELPASPASEYAHPEKQVVETPPPTLDELRSMFADEFHALREEAATQGREEGLAEGLAKAQQQYATSIASLERVVAMLGDSLDKGIEGLTEIGAAVVFEAVTKILGRSFIDQSGVTSVVKEVIRQAKDRSRLLIRVNPLDYRDLMSGRESLTEGLNVQQIEFTADDRVELGGCLLETPSGNLDGRLEIQLQQLRDTVLSARHRRAESVLTP